MKSAKMNKALCGEIFCLEFSFELEDAVLLVSIVRFAGNYNFHDLIYEPTTSEQSIHIRVVIFAHFLKK